MKNGFGVDLVHLPMLLGLCASALQELLALESIILMPDIEKYFCWA